MHLNFPQQYLRAALMVSLLSVWVLVGLFYYLNRYTKRRLFHDMDGGLAVLCAVADAWPEMPDAVPGDVMFMLKQCCVAISAVFLLWGSLRFLSIPVRQTLIRLVHGVFAGLDI